MELKPLRKYAKYVLNALNNKIKNYILLLPNPPATLENALAAAKKFETANNNYTGNKNTLNTQKSTTHNEEKDSRNENNTTQNFLGKSHFRQKKNNKYRFRDFEYRNRELNNRDNRNCEEYNEMNYSPETNNYNTTKTISDENYYMQNNINFDNLHEPERENEKHRSEFNSNLIPIVCTLTKNKSKYDKIDVEESKPLDDLNQTKSNEKIENTKNPLNTDKHIYNSRRTN